MIPKVGTITPMRIIEEAGMNKTVLEKRTAVEVIVVKPRMGDISSRLGEDNEITDHRRGGTKPPST